MARHARWFRLLATTSIGVALIAALFAGSAVAALLYSVT